MQTASPTVTISQALQIALEHHQLGRLAQAEAIYQQILQVEPGNPDALHLLGLIAYQTGHIEAAVELIGKAISVQPSASMYCNLGNALRDQGSLEAAVERYREALSLQPDDAETRCNLGKALHEQGKLDAAVEQFQRVIAARPELAEAHIALGNAHKTQGRLDAAVASYRQAISLRPDDASVLNALGLALQAQGKLEAAIESYRNALSFRPDLFEPQHNLAVVLQIQGKLDAAIEAYQKAIAAKPDAEAALHGLALSLLAKGEAARAFEVCKRSLKIKETCGAKAFAVQCLQCLSFAQDDAEMRELIIRAMSEPWGRPSQLVAPGVSLINADATIKSCIERAAQAWPTRLSQQELYGSSGVGMIARDRLLRCLLEHTPACDLRLERFLTMARFVMLGAAVETSASGAPDEMTLAFYCAIARQCFINEHVYAGTDAEFALARALRDRLAVALLSGDAVPALWVAAVAAYFPLNSVPSVDALLETAWPESVSALLLQQVYEPREELQYLALIPCLTGIENEISKQVRQQYEENPYPRWVKSQPGGSAVPVDDFVHQQFPYAPFKPIGKTHNVDILIAGCGTGQHPIRSTQEVLGANVLAVDLSLASLCYAQRKTREIGLTNIEYAQADIMKLGSINRTFDVIESVGVLHHLAEPMAGWRVLVSLLRPGGLMRLGFYSELARQHVVAARGYIAEKGYSSTPEDIRRCRQELISLQDGSAFEKLLHCSDFFSTSECRDLLFHVQEHRFTLPQIKNCLSELDLRLIGFNLDAQTVRRYQARFPDDTLMTCLENWHAFEIDHPDTFSNMYQFLVQK